MKTTLLAGVVVAVATVAQGSGEGPSCFSCENYTDQRYRECTGSRMECGNAARRALNECKATCKPAQPIANARAPSGLLGAYEGWSRACHEQTFELTEKTISLFSCSERPYQLFDVGDDYVILEVKAGDACPTTVVRFEKEKPTSVGTFGGYVLYWSGSQAEPRSRCNFGRVSEQ